MDEATQPAARTRLAPSAPPAGCVSLHRWSLLCDADRLNELRGLLNQEERRRADRLVSDKLTRRFVAARAGLRTALGEALDRPPAEIAFDYGPMGKPSLPTDHGAIPLHFNLAHSGDEAALVIAQEPVGVDLEIIRPMPRAQAFAERWFHPEEQRRLEAAPNSDLLATFFEIWTAKEAALKLLGKGVGESLPRILTPEGGGWATELPPNDLEISRAWVARIDTDGVRAAIASKTVLAPGQ